MKAVFALFFLLISVVSFASNPDEILQPPTAFEQDYRQEHEVLPPQPNEDTLIEGAQPHTQSQQQVNEGQPKSALDQSAESLEQARDRREPHERNDYGEPQNDPRHEMGMQHNGGLRAGGNLPPHAQPHRGTHPPGQDGRTFQQAPFSAE